MKVAGTHSPMRRNRGVVLGGGYQGLQTSFGFDGYWLAGAFGQTEGRLAQGLV